uniref:Uncharacterized protein n=1 Tax=Strix occidentalis caurina TaxID=311401 RepID=A0A8D0KY99_STROC
MQAKDSNPPDGGYGWVVVVSAFMVMGLTAALLKTFGLFFVEIQQHFDELASTTSWMTSVTTVILHLGTPVASPLCVGYTHRAVVTTGGLLAFSGFPPLQNTSRVSNWCYFYWCFSGLEISFSWTSAISIVNHYFSKKRALSNAIVSAGECAFAFIFGPFFQWLISGIQLNICVCGVLTRPLASSCLLESPIIHKTFIWMLVRQPEFVLYAIFGILAAWSFFVPPLFLVPLTYSLGIDESWTASLLPILAMVDFAGRQLCDWYDNLHMTKSVHLLTMTFTLISTSLMLLPLADNYLSLAIFTGFYGFFFGTRVTVHITVLADVVGMSDFDSALRLFMGMVTQTEKIWVWTQMSPFFSSGLSGPRSI